MLKRTKRENPLPITSFYEDSFELHKRHKRENAAQYLRRTTIRHRILVIVIRLIITVLAIVTAFWLYALVDDFLSYIRNL